MLVPIPFRIDPYSCPFSLQAFIQIKYEQGMAVLYLAHCDRQAAAPLCAGTQPCGKFF